MPSGKACRSLNSSARASTPSASTSRPSSRAMTPRLIAAQIAGLSLGQPAEQLVRLACGRGRRCQVCGQPGGERNRRLLAALFAKIVVGPT